MPENTGQSGKLLSLSDPGIALVLERSFTGLSVPTSAPSQPDLSEATSRVHIVENWYEVDVIGAMVEDGFLTFLLDEDSIVVHHNRHYWMAMAKILWKAIRGGYRKTNN